jgi:hypothetical protein
VKNEEEKKANCSSDKGYHSKLENPKDYIICLHICGLINGQKMIDCPKFAEM